MHAAQVTSLKKRLEAARKQVCDLLLLTHGKQHGTTSQPIAAATTAAATDATGTGAIEMIPAIIRMANLPTSDPSSAGQLWNESGDLKVSAG